MSEQVEVDIIANDRASPAWKQQADMVHKYLGELSKMDAVQRTNEKSARDFEKAAKKAIEDSLTPLERYNKKLGELRTLLDSGKLSQEQYGRSVQKAKGEMDAADSSTKSWVSSITKFGPAALGVAAVGLAVRQVRNEIENLMKVQREAAEAQKSFAEIERDALINLSADMTPQELNSTVMRMSKAAGTTPTAAMSAMNAALAFKGGSTSQEASESAEAALLLNPNNQSASTENTKASLLLRQKNPGVNAKSVQGFMIAAQQQSPSTDNLQFSQNVAPAIANSGSTGDSPREAAAYVTAIQSSIGDSEGRVSATAWTQMRSQLAEALPNLKSTNERIDALQNNPKYENTRRKLLGVWDEKGKVASKAASASGDTELHGEAKAISTIRDIIKGKNITSDAVEANRKVIPEINEGESIFEGKMKIIGSSRIQQNAQLDRTVKAFVEEKKLQNIEGGRAAISRDGLQDILRNTGASDITQKFVGAQFEAESSLGTKNPVPAMISAIKKRAKNLTEVTYMTEMEGPVTRKRNLTPKQQKEVDELNRVSESLQDIDVRMQKSDAGQVAPEVANPGGDSPLKVKSSVPSHVNAISPLVARPTPVGTIANAPLVRAEVDPAWTGNADRPLKIKQSADSDAINPLVAGPTPVGMIANAPMSQVERQKFIINGMIDAKRTPKPLTDIQKKIREDHANRNQKKPISEIQQKIRRDTAEGRKPRQKSAMHQKIESDIARGREEKAELRELITILKQQATRSNQPQKVEVVNQGPTHFVPGVDPSPAAARPAAALGG